MKEKIEYFLDWFFNPDFAMVASVLAIICSVISLVLIILGY